MIHQILPVMALLAAFVAGLFARSILEHEASLWRRVRLGTEITRANRLGVTRPLAPTRMVSGPDPHADPALIAEALAASRVTRADLERQDADRQRRAFVDGRPTDIIPSWPSRL